MNITPSMIDTSDHFWDSFGKLEREVSARLFCIAAKLKGGWTLTISELNAQDKWGRFRFNGLTEGGFITDNGDSTFTATAKFILLVHSKFPTPCN